MIATLRRLGRKRQRQQGVLDITTAELHDAITAAIADGMSIADAARFSGYHRNNVSRLYRRTHD